MKELLVIVTGLVLLFFIFVYRPPGYKEIEDQLSKDFPTNRGIVITVGGNKYSLKRQWSGQFEVEVLKDE